MQVTSSVASRFRHLLYSGGKPMRIPAKTNINPAGTAIRLSAVNGSAWIAAWMVKPTKHQAYGGTADTRRQPSA
jgi:hypothetical protein